MKRFAVFMFICLTLACAAQKKTTIPQDELEVAADIDTQLRPLTEEIENRIKRSPYAPGEIVVVSGTLLGKTQTRFSQLELRVIEVLRENLAESGCQLREITLDDWRFLKALGSPGKPPCHARSKYLVLEVNVNPTEANKTIRIWIEGYTFSENKRKNTDIVSSITLDYSMNSLARRLYEERPVYIPAPEGSEENPFSSINDLARDLASQAVDSYPTGKSATIDVKAIGPVSPRLILEIKDAITHYLDDYVNIEAGYEDFRQITKRLKFEQKEWEFELKDVAPFSTANIIILVDIMNFSPEDSIFRISMRAFWLIDLPGRKVKGLKAVGYARHRHFEVMTKLNKAAFKTGEKLLVEVRPVGKDSFIWIFNKKADGEVLLIFPHRKDVDNFFKHGRVVKLPAKEADYVWKIVTEHDREVEKICVVAVTYEVDSPEMDDPDELRISEREFQKWLHSIPEKDRSISCAKYTVVR